MKKKGKADKIRHWGNNERIKKKEKKMKNGSGIGDNMKNESQEYAFEED